MDKIIKKIKEQYKNQKIILALSCGVDSTTLLDILLKSINKDDLYICFVNHKVRLQAEDEEQYIKSYCKEKKIKLFIKHLDKIDNNFEEEARNKRLEFFLQTAKEHNIKYIFLAHHALDNIETIIMRFLRSSSLKGYSGMEEVTKYKDVYLVRPLLKKSKEEIIDYAKKNNLIYFTDTTNFENDHLRNRIRNNIIPLLLKENPNLIEASINYSETLRESANYILDNVYQYINENIKKINNDLILDLNNFISLSPFFQKQVLFEALKAYQLSINEINEIIKNINNDNNKIIYSINNELNFIKEYNKIIFTNKNIKPIELEINIKKEDKNKLKDIEIEIIKNSCYIKKGDINLCYNNIDLPISIRTRKDKDKIRRTKKNKVTGEISYYTQSLSNYLTNKKIPTLDRNNYLYLVKDNNLVIYIIKDFVIS